MSSSPAPEARPRKILVIANETCAARGVVEEVRYRGGPGAEVMIVAPALARTRLEHWLTSDLERRRADALVRLDASTAAFAVAGIPAQGALGDADPLQALDDAIRTFDPDEVVISTHPPQRSNWLERQVVARARSRYDLPITHVVVDLELESSAPPGARSARRPGDRARRRGRCASTTPATTTARSRSASRASATAPRARGRASGSPTGRPRPARGATISCCSPSRSRSRSPPATRRAATTARDAS